MHVHDFFRSLRARPGRWLAPLALLLNTSLAAAEENETRAIAGEALCKTHWTIDLDWLPYCRNQRIGELRETIRRAVIVIHGKQR
ncbi:MAG TPA: hypothetical protein VJU61_09190, partial [Polyangiaceae bacterium]|nr:hypothetical protein [Polyangiaceae bacterium]